ncbi:PIF1 helicase-like protein [Trypanosoma grayi]|uniref:PIF1 helicase-like protein n=1 Tax=Trypanosoma grayi TaxID=71804 RepID=UPI0004F448C8|nr:PIF1 helicase-like protein [Trypanosoma grayi]KEG13633.1 PIF1 helicase-like protein [Trypanosoma grayi]
MVSSPSAETTFARRVGIFAHNASRRYRWVNTLPSVFIRRATALPSLLHASECLAPAALLSDAPPLTSGAVVHNAATPVRAVLGLETHATCFRWRRQPQWQVSISKTSGGVPLCYQSRGLTTTGIREPGCQEPATAVVSRPLLKPTQQEQHQQRKKDGPRLICQARWSERRKGGVTADGEKTKKCAEATGLVTTSGEKALRPLGAHRPTETKKNFSLQQQQQQQQPQQPPIEQNVYNNFAKVGMETATPPPPFPHTVSAVEKGGKDDGLVYNVFTHRVTKCSAASVRALATLGIGVRDNAQELDVVNPAALMELREKLIRREVSWPKSWRNALFQQLQYILLRAPSQEEAVTDARSLLETQYQRAKNRRGVGVVAPGNDADTTDGVALSDSDSFSSGVSFKERLLTYRDLNEEQQRVVDFVLNGYNTYIGGGAGTGKSLLLRVIKQELVSRGLTVAVTATTGIAAARIDGVTLHHCFGVNIYGETTRRAELKAFDVIIIDEVSMLSKEIFETLEYQLRRANGVDLPFGGVQMILTGDFLQLGAIASMPIVHSAVFRRHFAMLKLQKVVRQLGNDTFVQQLQELRRGTVPHDLHDTITFLSPSDGAKAVDNEEKGAVRLLPTNKEVNAVNQAELDRLSGEPVTFPARLQPPALLGRWTATHMLEIHPGDPTSVDAKQLAAALEKYVLEFVNNVPHASRLTLSLLGQRYIVLYKLFVDAFAFRVRIPPEMDEKDEQGLACHLRSLESWLPAQGLGVRLREIVVLPDGLHMDVDEYILTRYANNSPMSSPLQLKKGAKVMLRVNLAPGLVNGSLGVVVGFKELRAGQLPRYLTTPARLEAVESYIECMQYEHGFATAIVPEVDFGGGRVIVVPPTLFSVGGLSNTNHYHMGIVALPLTLAYAFTVHKVQGLTLVGRVHLELSRMWPCEHLLYVAMSRVRNPEQLTVSSFQNDLVRCASECLVFDDSLPPVERVRVLPHFFQATWHRVPSRRKAALRRKLKDKELQQKHDEKNSDGQKRTLRKRVKTVSMSR